MSSECGWSPISMPGFPRCLAAGVGYRKTLNKQGSRALARFVEKRPPAESACRPTTVTSLLSCRRGCILSNWRDLWRVYFTLLFLPCCFCCAVCGLPCLPEKEASMKSSRTSNPLTALMSMDPLDPLFSAFPSSVRIGVALARYLLIAIYYLLVVMQALPWRTRQSDEPDVKPAGSCQRRSRHKRRVRRKRRPRF